MPELENLNIQRLSASPPRRAWIFANGLVEDISALRDLVTPEDYLIAADGGARFIRAIGRLPHLLVGDLDSLDQEEVNLLREQGVIVHQYRVDKDETDLELAVNFAVQLHPVPIRIAAALGGRLDQSLGNIFQLLRPDLSGCDIRLDDGQVEAWLIRSSAIIQGAPGDGVSLLPLMGSVEGVATHGLKYPLNGETLYPERTRGISNRMVDSRAEVTIRKGILLCIHTRNRS